MAENNKKPDVNRKSSASLLLFVILAIGGTGIYLLFFRKKKIVLRPQHIDVPFPYIFNRAFYQELQSYTHQSQFSNSLYVFGPKGVGKTSGFYEFSHQLIENGTLSFVFNFRALSKNATKYDLLKQIRNSIASAFNSLDGKHYNSTALKAFFPLIESFSQFTDNKVLPNAGSKLGHRKFKGLNLQDQNLEIVADFLITLRLDSLLGIRAFFETLDALEPILHPTLFVISIENLVSSKERPMNEDVSQFAHNFLTSVERFSNENRSVPIIFEVSDERALFDGRLPSDKSYLKPFYVGDFSLEDAKTILIKKKKIFRPEELDKLSEALGNNGQYLSEAHNLMGEGLTVQEAIKMILKNARDNVIRLTRKGDSRTNEMVLKSLSNNNFELDKSGMRLLKWGIGGLKNMSVISVQGKVMDTALKQLVDTTNPTKK